MSKMEKEELQMTWSRVQVIRDFKASEYWSIRLLEMMIGVRDVLDLWRKDVMTFAMALIHIKELTKKACGV